MRIEKKRKIRACPKCKYRQYYRKKTDDWRCDRCGFISNGQKTEEESYGLFPSSDTPPKPVSPERRKIIKTLEEFQNREHKYSYIQFECINKLKRTDANIRTVIKKHNMNIKVIRKTHLLRVYLEKIIT